MPKTKSQTYGEKETAERFAAILLGAMHKPTLHKDVPKHRTKRTDSRKKRQRHEAS